MRLPRRRHENDSVKRCLSAAAFGEQHVPPMDRIEAPAKNSNLHGA
jgi:hypothetical protein